MFYNVIYVGHGLDTWTNYLAGLTEEDLQEFIKSYGYSTGKYFFKGKTHYFTDITNVSVFDTSKAQIESESDYFSNLDLNIIKWTNLNMDIEFEFNSLGSNVTTKFIKGPYGYLNDSKMELKMNSVGKIFISHSSLDHKIVNSFCELILEQGLSIILSKDVFSTSLDGSKPISGEDFRKRIKQELLNSKLVLQFISQNYKKSEVCLNEMGAAWVLNAKVIPLIIEPEKYDVGFIHNTDQQIQLSRKGDLLKLITDHKKTFTSEELNLPRLVEKAEQFLKILKDESLNSKIQKVFPNT